MMLVNVSLEKLQTESLTPLIWVVATCQCWSHYQCISKGRERLFLQKNKH